MHHKNTETESAPNTATKAWGFWVTGLQCVLRVMKLSSLFRIDRAVGWNSSWPVGCCSLLKPIYTPLAPGSPGTGSSSRESRILPVATKQSWFSHLHQTRGQTMAAEVRAVCVGWQLLLGEDGGASGRKTSVLTQFCLSFLPLRLLCKEGGARVHLLLWQGKSPPLALLRSLRGVEGALLPNNLLANRSWWPKPPGSSPSCISWKA